MVVQAVRGEDHLVVLVERVAPEGQGRVGGRADHVGHAGQLQHVGHVPTAATLDVEGVDGAAVQHAQRVVDRQALVEPVGVQGDLDVVLLGDVQRRVEGAGVGAHVLVHLEPARAALDQRLDQRRLVATTSRGRGSRC